MSMDKIWGVDDFACLVVLHVQMQGDLSCTQTPGQQRVQFWALVEHPREHPPVC